MKVQLHNNTVIGMIIATAIIVITIKIIMVVAVTTIVHTVITIIIVITRGRPLIEFLGSDDK